MTRLLLVSAANMRRLYPKVLQLRASASAAPFSTMSLQRSHRGDQQGQYQHAWTSSQLLTAGAAAAAALTASLGWSVSQCEGPSPKEKGKDSSPDLMATSAFATAGSGMEFASRVTVWAGKSLRERSATQSTKFQVMKGLEVKEDGDKVRLAKLLRDLHVLASEQLASNVKRSIGTMTMNKNKTSAGMVKAGTLSLKDINLQQIQPSEVQRLVEGLAREELLDRKSVVKLIKAAVDVLKEEDTMVDLRSASHPSSPSKVYVVGDLHGSLKCLQRVTDIVGGIDDDPDRCIVFAGDFVDRGENSLEVFFTLLLYKLAYPKNVILLRGNHEDTTIAGVWGLSDEICDKYGAPRGTNIFESFSALFAALPLCAVTDSSFIVHGGLPHDGFSLDQVTAITREQRNKLHTVIGTHNEQEELIANMLWSDPSYDNGISENPRGSGIHFGPDVAKDFLDRHNLKYIVRGHEAVENGTEIMDCGNGKAVVTVFSNANYPRGEGENLGAVVQLDKDGDASAMEFFYTGHSRQEANNAEKVLQPFIIKQRRKLVSAFEKYQSKNGTVSQQQWVQVMRDTLQIPTDLPWAELQQLLAPSNPGTQAIDWRAHLNRVAPSVSDSLDHEQVSILESNQDQVKKMFEFFDADGSQSIDRNEFFLGIQMLNRKLLPPSKHIKNPEALFHWLDVDGNGEIDINEFNTGMSQSASLANITASLGDDEEMDNLKEHSEMLLAVFNYLDLDGSGTIDREEFRTGIQILNKRLPEASRFKDVDKLFDALDTDKSGDIDIDEFNEVFNAL